CLVNLSLAHHQNSNAGAVQYRDSAEIEDDFPGMLTENFRQFQFHFARAIAQDDAAMDFEDFDVGRNLLSLDAQDHGAPLCQEARSRRCSIAIGLGSMARTESTSRTGAVERNSMRAVARLVLFERSSPRGLQFASDSSFFELTFDRSVECVFFL